jgi:hypothetical protein
VDGLTFREPFLIARDAAVFVGPVASTFTRFFETDRSMPWFSLSEPIISALYDISLRLNIVGICLPGTFRALFTRWAYYCWVILRPIELLHGRI